MEEMCPWALATARRADPVARVEKSMAAKCEELRFITRWLLELTEGDKRRLMELTEDKKSRSLTGLNIPQLHHRLHNYMITNLHK